MSNALKELADIQKKENLDYLKDKANLLKELIEDEWADLVLEDFDKYISPFFTGKVPISEENIAAFLTNVLKVTGSYFRGIRILKDGKPFLYYPPLLLDIKHDEVLENIAFSRVVKEYKALLNDPFGKDKLLLESVSDGLSKVINVDYEKVKDYLEKLKELYAYYGLLKKNPDKENKDTTTNEDNEDIGDIIDYD